ncbi:MAG: hypothetical protein PHU49_06790 [Syntrophorhabdaceae bacterium]|nr:hypothetical protein [Syntrophorhabdaceae bacterium]MDD5243708.1 hypothetical protein [Syntrophorhabdaceae bacterium]
MTDRRQANYKFIVWLSAALVLIGTGFNAVPSFAETIYYTYDDLNRLTAIENPNAGGTRYEYDEVGNRLSKTFAFKTWPLNVILNDTAGGTVTSTNGDIYCGSSCLATYNYGTRVTLIATPNTAYNFTGWSGACTGTGNCTITMDSSKNVTANFMKKTFAIDAIAIPDENGISPSGTIAVQYGDNTAFTIGSKAGYTLTDVKVDGMSIEAATSYVFSNVTADHTITATYNCTGSICPAGFTLEGGICHKPADCPNGTLNTQYDACINDILPVCPSGYVYVPERSRCEVTPSCSAGSYDGTHDRCQKPVYKGCTTGYTYAAARDRCEITPSCPSGGSYSKINNRCKALPSYSYTCSSTGSIYGSYNACTSNCLQTTTCASALTPVSLSGNGPGGTIDFASGGVGIYFGSTLISITGATVRTGSPIYMTSMNGSISVSAAGNTITFVNNDGGAQFGSIIVDGAVVTSSGSGTLKGEYYRVIGSGNQLIFEETWTGSSSEVGRVTFTGTTAVYTCPYGTGYTCDADHNCKKPAECSTNTECPAGYTSSGDGGGWGGGGAATCFADASCPNGGSLDAQRDVCQLPWSAGCDPGWSYDDSLMVCHQAPLACGSGGTIDTTHDVCQLNGTVNCDSGYTWDPDISRCRMLPQCPTGLYSTVSDRCETAPISCP